MPALGYELFGLNVPNDREIASRVNCYAAAGRPSSSEAPNAKTFSVAIRVSDDGCSYLFRVSDVYLRVNHDQ